MNENFKYESFPTPYQNSPIVTPETSLLVLARKPVSPRVIAQRFNRARLMMIVMAGLSATGLIAQNFEQPREAKGAMLAAADINWSFGSDMICSRAATGSTVLPDGSIFEMGGTGAEGVNCQDNVIYSNANYKRDALGNWSVKSPLPVRISGGDAEYINGKIYVTGGEGVDGISQSPLKKVQVYDVANDTWTMGPDLPKERTDHQAIAVGNKLAIIGGYDKNGVTLKSVDILDTNTLTYSSGPDMLDVRSSFGAAKHPVSNEIYVFEGNSGNGLSPLLKSEKLNANLTMWTQLAAPSKSRYGHQTVYLPETGIFVNIAGKNVEVSEAFKDVETYNPTLNSYGFDNDISIRRELMSANYVNGKIIVTGGATNSAPSIIKSSEIGTLAGLETATSTPTSTPTQPIGASSPTPTKTPEKPTPTNTVKPAEPTPTPTEQRPRVVIGDHSMFIPAAPVGNQITRP